MNKPKQTFSVRLDEELVEAAREEELNLSEIFNAALAKAVESKKCPYCNQELEHGD